MNGVTATVLVVDDEPAVRDAVARALRYEGYTVVTAADGQEALEAQALAPADAIVLDVLMPNLDGLEVCRRLRIGGDPVPVLMLTAREPFPTGWPGSTPGPTTTW